MGLMVLVDGRFCRVECATCYFNVARGEKGKLCGSASDFDNMAANLDTVAGFYLGDFGRPLAFLARCRPAVLWCFHA